MTLEEVSLLQETDYAGARERNGEVASIHFDEEGGRNVAVADNEEGETLFLFAWRPFMSGEQGYTEEGLFICG